MFYPTFSIHSDSPSKILSVALKELLCRNRDIPPWAILPQHFPLSAPHGEQLTTNMYYSLLASHFVLKDQNIFNHNHMRALARVRFPAEEHTWKMRFCGFAGEVFICNCAWCIWQMKSVPLHVSLNLHSNTGLSNIDQGMADNGPECKVSVTQIQSIYATVHIFIQPLYYQGQRNL